MKTIYIGSTRLHKRRWINWGVLAWRAVQAAAVMFCVVVYGLAVYGALTLFG